MKNILLIYLIFNLSLHSDAQNIEWLSFEQAVVKFNKEPKEMFWVAGTLIGLMVGPNQSCSRSLMAQLTPKEKQNEFFGFFALTGKATSFLGPLLFGIITNYYSQQIALWVVIILFLVGLFLFNRITFTKSNKFVK